MDIGVLFPQTIDIVYFEEYTMSIGIIYSAPFGAAGW